jgi:HK97 family phage major capsid protein
MAEAALRERAEIFEKRKALFESDATDAEKREQAERMDADMDRLATEAREAVQAGERESEVRDLMGRAGALSKPAEDRSNEGEPNEFIEGIRAVLLGETRGYDFTASERAFRAASDVIAGVDAANGSTSSAAITPDTFVATMLESFRETSAILGRVRKMSTAAGETMTLPRRNARVTGAFQKVAEAAGYSFASDGSWTPVEVGAHKFGAIAELSEESLTDPALSILPIVARELGEDLAEDLAAEVLNGAGDGTLLGESIVAGLTITETVGSAAAAADDAVYDQLMALQHAIRTPYRRNASWTVGDEFALELRQVKDGDNHYIWQPAVVAGQPDLLLGKPVDVEAGMPAKAASAVNALYGDVERFYTLRQVRNIGVTRSDEYGFDRDTVALKIRWRGDGFVYDPQALAGGTWTV